jgi:hypothetical protein
MLPEILPVPVPAGSPPEFKFTGWLNEDPSVQELRRLSPRKLFAAKSGMVPSPL